MAEFFNSAQLAAIDIIYRKANARRAIANGNGNSLEREAAGVAGHGNEERVVFSGRQERAGAISERQSSQRQSR